MLLKMPQIPFEAYPRVPALLSVYADVDASVHRMLCGRSPTTRGVTSWWSTMGGGTPPSTISSERGSSWQGIIRYSKRETRIILFSPSAPKRYFFDIFILFCNFFLSSRILRYLLSFHLRLTILRLGI